MLPPAARESLTTGIRVQVVKLLPPERFRVDRLGMSRRLPESPLAIDGRLFSQHLGKACRKLPPAKFGEPASSELAKVCQGRGQSHRVKPPSNAASNAIESMCVGMMT
jgi:hypothetical protein